VWTGRTGQSSWCVGLLRQTTRARVHEARQSRARRRWPASERVRKLLASSAGAAALLAGALAAVAYSAVSGHTGHNPTTTPSGVVNASVASVRLPAAGLYQSLTDVQGHLLLSGGPDGSPLALTPAPASRGRCRRAAVDPRTLALSQQAMGACENPQLFLQGVLAVLDNVPGAVNGSTLRVSRVGARGKVSMGPVLLRYTDLPGTEPEVTYGDGYLWAYVPLATHGAELLAVSETSGLVASRVKVPEVYRPLLLANASGLWFVAEKSLGPPVDPGLYHVAVGQSRPVLVERAASGQWLAGWGRTLWFGTSGNSGSRVVQLTGNGVNLDTELRPEPAGPALSAEAPAGATSYAGAPGGKLWAVTGGPCARYVLQIQPATGTYREVAFVPAPPGCRASQEPPQAAPLAVVRGDLFFLQPWGAGHYGALFRVSLAGTR